MATREEFEAKVRKAQARRRLARILSKRYRGTNTVLSGPSTSYPRTVVLLSRDPSKPAGWRVTRFDGETEEPYGHTEFSTYDAALEEFFVEYKVVKPKPVR